MRRFEQRARRSDRRPRWPLFLLLALLLHASLGTVGSWIVPWLFDPPHRDALPTRLVIVQPPPEPEPEALEDPERPDVTGQIVDVARPLDPQKPVDAEYLSEYDITVPEETRTDAYKVNPEIVAPKYSDESKLQSEDILDVNVDRPSTGAKVGNDRFDPDRQGNFAALPSPWARTNKDGVQDPVPASHTASSLAGAPQNDRLNERLGDQVALNTREYLYAGYLQRIRRLVNFYWVQCVDNLPANVRFAKTTYTTDVAAILDAQGALDTIEVTDPSGSSELDACVVQAFHVAGPFPNPPEGLIEKDNRVYLPAMSFEVNLGVARMQYQGVDPRAGVMFPGILKSPR